MAWLTFYSSSLSSGGKSIRLGGWLGAPDRPLGGDSTLPAPTRGLGLGGPLDPGPLAAEQRAGYADSAGAQVPGWLDERFRPAAVVIAVLRWSRGDARRRRADPRNLPGTATRGEVLEAAGPRTVTRRARHARPSLPRPCPHEVGYLLGRSHGAQAWASVEDSILVVGPPRSGKGLHVVIPMLFDAPGAVVTTSTRPDNLAVTYAARRAIGDTKTLIALERLVGRR